MNIWIVIAYILIIAIGILLLYMTFKTNDRRYIFLSVAFYVIFPILITLDLPITVSPEVRQLYEAVDNLPDSSTVMLTFDYYPSTVAETEPMSRAALHHLFRKDCKIVTMTTIPLGGPSMAERVTRELAAEYNKKYGVDFVNLGYKANYVAVLKGMGTSIEAIYPTDNSGTTQSEIPLMKNVKNYYDIKFVFIVADNSIVDNWISIVNAQYSTPMGAGVTAVMAPRYFAYIGSGQMTGMLGGMKGAAEYEDLVDQTGLATKGMAAQSLVHLFVIVSVIAGNLVYFAGKRKKDIEKA
jgi:hypothetical protein